MVNIRITGPDGETLAERMGPRRAELVYEGDYPAGSDIEVITDSRFIRFKPDAAVDTALLYVPDGRMSYRIPYHAELTAYSPAAFSGRRKLVTACAADARDFTAYRNLALNPADSRGSKGAYPHATANIETRNEADFAARNAIDGLHVNHSHGSWPFGSWGIGTKADAEITIEFGRDVLADSMVLYLRADFPHDAWWAEATVVLSDGFKILFPLARTEGAQRVELGEHRISWIRLEQLVKADDPSPYPALSEWEVYGREIIE